MTTTTTTTNLYALPESVETENRALDALVNDRSDFRSQIRAAAAEREARKAARARRFALICRLGLALTAALLAEVCQVRGLMADNLTFAAQCAAAGYSLWQLGSACGGGEAE